MRKKQKMSLLAGYKAQEDEQQRQLGVQVEKSDGLTRKEIRSSKLKSSVSVTVQGQGRIQDLDL